MKKLLLSAVLAFLGMCSQVQAATLWNDYYNTYMSTVDPTSNDNSVNNNTIPFYYWFNSSTGEIFVSSSPDNTNITWGKFITSLNLATEMASAAGWNINTTRAYTAVGSPTFNSSRTPNTTHDTNVAATMHVNATVLQSSSFSAQEDCGSGFSEIGRVSTTLGILVNEDKYMDFIVSANCAYKIVASGTGTNSIISFKEKLY